MDNTMPVIHDEHYNHYVLLNNELEKIQGRIDELDEKINNIVTGITIIVERLKYIQYDDEIKRPSFVDSLPDDDKLDAFEDKEGTYKDYSRVSDDQLSEKELAPFTKNEEPSRLQKIFDSIPLEVEEQSFAKKICNSCMSDEQLDAIEKKEMEEYVKNINAN